jgi:hypothetical protein
MDQPTARGTVSLVTLRYESLQSETPPKGLTRADCESG